MIKRLLSLSDLYDFFEYNGKNVVFDSIESKTVFSVKMPGKAVFEESEIKGLTKVNLCICHDGVNRNHFDIPNEVNQEALHSFKTRPILAYIRDVDGQEEFAGHEFYEENNERVYLEQPIGVISSTEEPYIKYDENYQKNYIYTTGYLFSDYNHAADIIKREGGMSDVSMEIDIESLSYDAMSHIMKISKYTATGVTVLGIDDFGEEIDPAMIGANITLADFEVGTNVSTFSDSKFIEKVDELMNMLSAFQYKSKSSKKGGTKDVNKFDELLAKYSVTAEQIAFEYENLSDEELETKFAEVFEESSDSGESGSDTSDSNESGTGDVETDEPGDESDTAEDETVSILGTSGGNIDADTDNNDSVTSKKKVYTITDPTGKTFSISLNDRINAIDQLVNATYADGDNDFYFSNVFDDYVVFQSWCTGKLYKQSYADENGTFSLTGERVEVFTEYLTAEEQNTLKVIRGEYAELKEYKESSEAAKATAARDEVFEKFSAILNGNAEFEELKKGEFSAEELELRCNALVGAQQMASFAAHDENKPKKVLFDFNGKTDTRKPYGGLFDDEK